MSTVGTQRRARWAVVAAGVVLIISAPSVASITAGVLDGARGAAAAAGDARSLLGRALGAQQVGYQGVAESRGTLGLPDLPRLDTLPALLGGTTRTRVWWSSPRAWRVDTLTTTGEQGSYGVGDDVVSWDYERRTLSTTIGTPSARLPRAEDLLPPQAVRRLLGHTGPQDVVQRLGDRRIAGHQAAGIRVRPSDARSTLARVDLWVHRSGLPLELRVADRNGIEALASRFIELRRADPDPRLLLPPAAPGVRRDSSMAPDLVARMVARTSWLLPPRLADLPAAGTLLGGSVTYGDGLVRVVLAPVPPGLARRVGGDAEDGGAPAEQLPGGEATLVGSSVLNALLVRDDDAEHAYLIAGLVTPDVLRQAAVELLADPPPRRFG